MAIEWCEFIRWKVKDNHHIIKCSNNCNKGLSITPYNDYQALLVGASFNNSMYFKQAL